MKCSVTFRHMKSNDAVRRYAEERVDKLTRLIDRGVEAQVTLEATKHTYTAHIELVTDGSLAIRGQDTSEDLQGSIDAAVERIMRQVKRYRAKIKSHRPAQGGQSVRQTIFESADAEEEAKTPQLVKQETVIAPSLSLDEAIMQMELVDTEFLVFTNQDSQQVNVVYRLPDGQFGLIEAHPSN